MRVNGPTPLNSPMCPHCHESKCGRIGFDPKQGGSFWRCKKEECGKTFLVPTLLLKKIDA